MFFKKKPTIIYLPQCVDTHYLATNTWDVSTDLCHIHAVVAARPGKKHPKISRDNSYHFEIVYPTGGRELICYLVNKQSYFPCIFPLKIKQPNIGVSEKKTHFDKINHLSIKI